MSRPSRTMRLPMAMDDSLDDGFRRPMVNRIAVAAPKILIGLYVLLFASTVAGAVLFAYTVSASQRSLQAGAVVEEARSALLREKFDEGRYSGASIAELQTRVAEVQAATREALKKLAVTTQSTRGHVRINDETLLQHQLHADAVAALISQLGSSDLRDGGVARLRSARSAALQDVDDSFLAVERSLNSASREIIEDARSRATGLRSIVIVAVLVGPVLFGIGLAGIAMLGEAVRRDQRRRQDRLERETAMVCFNERRFRSLVHNATDLVLLCDASGQVIFANPSAGSLWGHSAGSLMQQPLLSLLDPADAGAVSEFIAVAPTDGMRMAIRIETRIVDEAGQWRDADMVLHNLLSDPDVQAIVCVARDIGHRKERERSLHDLALHDPVSGLPNGRLLHDRLEQAVLRCRRRKAMVGLVLIGTGRGHEDAAETILMDRIGRIRGALRVTDTIARLHDGCLAVVLEDLEDEPALRLVADRLTSAAAGSPAMRWNDEVNAPALGVTLVAATQTDAESLLQHAQLALDRAAPGTWFLFDADLRERTLDLVERAGDLRAADLPAEMALLFEPVVQLVDQSLSGFVARPVWTHAVHGRIGSVELSRLTDEAGVVVPVGRWMMEEACRQVAAWQALGRFDPLLSMRVRIAAGHLYGPSFSADVAHAVSAAGIRPGCLQLEIPEAALHHDMQMAIARLWEMRTLGVRVAVDGLGSGLSALPMLRQVPVDLVAINVGAGGMDRSDSLERACAMTALARSLSLQVGASGIETGEQAEQLASWGCELGQGPLFEAPLSAEDATLVVRSAARARMVRASQGPRPQPPLDGPQPPVDGTRPRPQMRGGLALQRDDGGDGRELPRGEWGAGRRPQDGGATRLDQEAGQPVGLGWTR